MTYAFTTTDTTFTLSVDGSEVGTWPRTPQAENIYDVDISDSVLILSFKNSYYNLFHSIYYTQHIRATDTLTIDGVEQTGTVYQKEAALKEGVLYTAAAAPATAGYKTYVATLWQSGIGAPVVTVLENTLGGELTWARTSIGTYYGTLAGAFPEVEKMVTLAGSTGGGWVDFRWLDTDRVMLQTGPTFGGTDDSWLIDTPVEIRVYP